MKIYLVGGAVRDLILEIPSKEKDWVVVGASPVEMEKLGFKLIGKDFPVFLHPKTKEEYALARKERKTGLGHKGFTFYSDSSVSLEEDLIRRDLTINAIAQNVENNDLIDPYGGINDIKNKILKKVSSAFSEDPLRVLRVARFKAKLAHLDFFIEDETLKTMKSISSSGEINTLSKERIWQETIKALSEENPEEFFEVLNSCDALREISTEASEGYQKSKGALKIITKYKFSPEIVWSVFCSYSGSVERISKSFKAPKKFIESAEVLSNLLSFLEKKEVTPENILKVLLKCDALRRPERAQALLPALEKLSIYYKYPKINWEELLIRSIEIVPDKNYMNKSGKNISKNLAEKRLILIKEVLRVE
ncbi:MAG: multifunctional CCA tRNA nucleotidyl transferase/2'3'-cyclic phosphodiesterase/2'nucleotidase/phosphatase [SAR86 cluster bacterium]|nr:multifunctional CCA tRNA nucleotidyl transferase/2'3'-cyclic phosphodiesterase/2'nucleotidase/phosphatase [SAR86 cluster bacterium]